MTSGNPYLDHYREQLAHQREHGPRLPTVSGLRTDEHPHEVCIGCLNDPERPVDDQPHGVKLRFAWAVPSDAALDAIDRHSPNGVVEIGAGGGYWARMLRARGVDVAAYDPFPAGTESDWHSGYEWSQVDAGDHRVVSKHPDRTLLLVWPSYASGWTDEVVELFEGDTVVYVGEPPGGCTGTRPMHELLGYEAECWCFVGPCECPPAVPALFGEVERVAIPQWWGMNDYLSVHRRLSW